MHAEQPEPAAHHRSIAWPALFDPSARCRCSEVDDPYLEYAPKQFYIKLVFPNSLSGRRTSPIPPTTNVESHPIDTFHRSFSSRLRRSRAFCLRSRRADNNDSCLTRNRTWPFVLRSLSIS